MSVLHILGWIALGVAVGGVAVAILTYLACCAAIGRGLNW